MNCEQSERPFAQVKSIDRADRQAFAGTIHGEGGPFGAPCFAVNVCECGVIDSGDGAGRAVVSGMVRARAMVSCRGAGKDDARRGVAELAGRCRVFLR